jgi:hypothetical protein
MNRSAQNARRRNIWCVLGLAIFLRTLLPISAYLYTRDFTIFDAADSASYILPARELIASHRFFSDGSPQAAVWNTPVVPAPDIVRTPGYPLLLTIGLMSNRLEVVTIAIQALLSCFTVYLVYDTTLLLFESEWPALMHRGYFVVESEG